MIKHLCILLFDPWHVYKNKKNYYPLRHNTRCRQDMTNSCHFNSESHQEKKKIKPLSTPWTLYGLDKANCSIREDLCVLLQIPIYSEVTLNPFIIHLSCSKISLMDSFLENTRDSRILLAKGKISHLLQYIWLERQHRTKRSNRMAKI